MLAIEIYTTPNCPYCIKAKKLLDTKNVQYKEIDVKNNDKIRSDMTLKSGGRTSVPQIFINKQHIGGCDDLYALESQGRLDALLLNN